ncbi:MAG: ankyrin repeat domain-containing protein [Kofleriaceae bacterium]
MSTINLEHQRKRAKDLRRAHAAGHPEAAARIATHLPRARGRSVAQILAARFILSEAQLVVAREAGFASWPAMRHALGDAGDVASVLEAALRGDPVHGVARSIHVAAALADAEAVRALLVEDPACADRRGGSRDWTPLLYLCCARAPHRPRTEIARMLLDAGADIDARGVVPGLTADSVTVLDDHVWRPIEGAAGCARDLALVELLLERNANLEQTTALLTRAVTGGDLAILRRLLAATPPWWQRIWALVACSELDRVEAARLIVAEAERPQVLGPALTDAIRMHRDPALVEIMVARVDDPANAVWQDALRLAVRHANAGAVALLRHRGIEVTLSATDRAIAACVAGMPAEPVALAAADHRMLAWSIRTGRLAAVAPLLALGVDPDTADTDGQRPLHLAVRAGATATVDALLAAGAHVDARDYEARTPLEVALALPARELAERLLAAGAAPDRIEQFAPVRDPDDALDTRLRARGAVERDDAAELFERAADAVAFGDLATLRELLDDEPGLVHARSPRPHRATLLHYTGANGTEHPRQRTPANAPAIAELLLERGADPDATCRLYGGPSTTLSLLLTSAIPRAAKLDGELVRVLARHGATLTRSDLAGAILYGMPLAVAALVEASVPVDDLLLAAGTNRVDLLAELVTAGASVDTRFQDGSTALHAAAAMNHEAAARFLLDHGADRTLRDHRWDGPPAAWARHNDHVALAELLESSATIG